MPSERGSRGTATVSDASTAGDTSVTDHVTATDADGDARPETSDRDTAAIDAIAWGPVRHDRLRSMVVGFGLAIVLGVAVVGAALASTVVSALTDLSPSAAPSFLTGASPGEAFVTLVFVLVIAILTVPYLYLSYGEWGREDGSIRERLPGLSSLRPGWLLLGAAVPLSLWATGVEWTAFGLRLPFAILLLVPLVLLWEGAEVTLDPRAHTVKRTYPVRGRSRTDDLNAVVRTRRIDLPRADTVFLLAYRGNEWYRSTPWLTVPRDRADAVEDALDDVLTGSDGPDRASVPERALLALVGSTTLVFGLALSAAGEGGAGLALGLLSAPFTLIFLALAARL
ncbi:hypothetical protein J2751_002392 [Halorubrum alkaliphilum]|uniref:Uncharacterized protein n=1 Tax=Halorubrum alkaliphilum TaxID=261290 RepID=A0A8T4GIA4_9EURY|nr:hypothetical protein [Halorubrum alkaliphilum]MBP1923350.1 hypothetical protein [Halorubrum alkaliphilum]